MRVGLRVRSDCLLCGAAHLFASTRQRFGLNQIVAIGNYARRQAGDQSEGRPSAGRGRMCAVGGEEHGGHATLAQLPQDGIAATERGFEAFEKICHTGKMCREMGWR